MKPNSGWARHSPRTRLATAGWLLAMAVVLGGCSKAPQTRQQTPPEVTVSPPVRQEVANCIELTGTVAPSRTVDLVARVSGYLQKAPFDEGSVVEAGKELFVIEPEPYEQHLRLAKAALTRAESEYERQVELSKENATSVTTVEKWLSDKEQAAAQVELAKLNLGYTTVAAPFKGRIGRRLVDPGNLVGPGASTKLATLDQLIPVYVNFNLNERDALSIREVRRQRGITLGQQPTKTPVYIGLQNQEGYPQEGTLDFVDSGVNPDSGTIPMRAIVENKDQMLFPGLFARVRVPLGPPESMLVVPNSAIGNDQEGDYVLVVKTGDLVARRGVVKGPLTPTGCAIRSGLGPADRVIVGGQMKVQPGMKVIPTTAAASQAALPNSTR